MQLVVLFLLALSLGCNGSQPKPGFIKEFFKVEILGFLRRFQVVEMYQNGELAVVLKAKEVETDDPALCIVIKVAKDVKISKRDKHTGNEYLRNEWKAYEYLENKYTEAKKTIPAQDLPILVKTYFLKELKIMQNGEKALVLGMECLEMDLIDAFSDTVENQKAQLSTEARKYGAEIMVILNFLQYAELTHRDIKPENFLLAFQQSSSGPRVRLVDFALAYFGDEKFTSIHPGTEIYACTKDLDSVFRKIPVIPCPKSDAQSSVYTMMVLASGQGLYWTNLPDKHIHKGDGFLKALDVMMEESDDPDLKQIIIDMNIEAGKEPEKLFDFMSYRKRFLNTP